MPDLIHRFAVLPALKDFISNILLIEGDSKIFGHGLNNIEPNGTAKLVLSLENSISGSNGRKQFLTKEGQISFVGMFDCSFKMEGLLNHRTRLLVIELSPLSTYRLLKIDQREHVNNICNLEECCGKFIRELEEFISNEPSVESKVLYLQNYLQKIFLTTQADLTFEYCIKRINQRFGIISVKELERYTGYSSRWLNIKFRQQLGISPKLYASIVRFKTLLMHIATSSENIIEDKTYLDYYYDQAHFIRDFKRYSGVTPGKMLVRA